MSCYGEIWHLKCDLKAESTQKEQLCHHLLVFKPFFVLLNTKEVILNSISNRRMLVAIDFQWILFPPFFRTFVSYYITISFLHFTKAQGRLPTALLFRKVTVIVAAIKSSLWTDSNVGCVFLSAGIELCLPGWRFSMTMVANFMMLAGQLLLPGLAVLCRDWQVMQVVVIAPLLLMLSYIW